MRLLIIPSLQRSGLPSMKKPLGFREVNPKKISARKGLAFFCLLIIVSGCASVPLREKMATVVKNGMSEKEVVETLGCYPNKRSEKDGVEILRFAYSCRRMQKNAKWYETLNWRAYFLDGFLIHFHEDSFSSNSWEDGLKEYVKKLRQEKVIEKYKEDAERVRVAAEEDRKIREETRRKEEERRKAEEEEKLRKEAEEKKYWKDLEQKILDPQTPIDVRKALSTKFEFHQQELKAEYQKEQDRLAEENKREIETRFSYLGGNYKWFHGYRIYWNGVNDQYGNLDHYHYGVYDENAEQVSSCDDNRCIYEWKTAKLLEMIANPSISQAERQALSLEHEQLVAEFQTKENERAQNQANARAIMGQYLVNKYFPK